MEVFTSKDRRIVLRIQRVPDGVVHLSIDIQLTIGWSLRRGFGEKARRRGPLPGCAGIKASEVLWRERQLASDFLRPIC
jgi:hypothetical protein